MGKVQQVLAELRREYNGYIPRIKRVAKKMKPPKKPVRANKARCAKEKYMRDRIKKLERWMASPRRETKPRRTSFTKQDAQWVAVRNQVIEIYGRVCNACGCTDKVMHVDHILPKSKYPELAYTLSNLQILCVKCNFAKGVKHG